MILRINTIIIIIIIIDIRNWCAKWLSRDQINETIANWVTNESAKPGKAFGTVKTHKDDNPLRLITSCCGTAIENLSAFTEFYLKPLPNFLLSLKIPLIF